MREVLRDDQVEAALARVLPLILERELREVVHLPERYATTTGSELGEGRQGRAQREGEKGRELREVVRTFCRPYSPIGGVDATVSTASRARGCW